MEGLFVRYNAMRSHSTYHTVTAEFREGNTRKLLQFEAAGPYGLAYENTALLFLVRLEEENQCYLDLEAIFYYLYSLYSSIIFQHMP